MSIKLTVEGLSGVLSQVRQYGKKVTQALNEELKETANNVSSQARTYCAVPSIASEIRVYKWGKIGFEVSTSTPYSAYLEFGTGDFAKALLSSYPEDWRAMARQFYINGQGRTYSDPFLYPAFIMFKYTTAPNLVKRFS